MNNQLELPLQEMLSNMIRQSLLEEKQLPAQPFQLQSQAMNHILLHQQLHMEVTLQDHTFLPNQEVKRPLPETQLLEEELKHLLQVNPLEPRVEIT